jgi:hypothetical protein
LKKNWKLWLGLLFIILLIYESIIKHNKDFDVFISASKLIFEGKTCYEVWLKSGTSGLKYFYSPLFAVLLFPLKNLPQIAYNFIWIGINLVIIYRTFFLLSFFLPLKNLSENRKKLFFILSILCSARYILDNLDLGQMTFLLVWASLEASKLISQKRFIAGSSLLALVINFKLIPIAILPYLFYKKEFKAFGLTLLFFALYLFIPSVVLGYEFNMQLVRSWLSSLTITESNSIYEDLGRPSLSSLIPSLIMETPTEFSVKRNFANLNAASTTWILNVVRLILLALLALLFGRPFKKATNKKRLFYDISLIFIATPLVFPHQGKYSFFYLMPAYAYCIYSLIKLHTLKQLPKYKRINLLVLVVVSLSFMSVTLTTDGLIGRKLSDFSEYIHLITYGTFFLLTAMIFLKPKRVTKLRN